MTRPNFIFILANDLGYAGARAHVSPQLDRLVAQGLQFGPKFLTVL